MAFRRNIVFSASEDRLERLLEDRLQPGADKDTIDERIWDLFGEEWVIMMTDLSGFSRGVEKYGIIHFLQTIQESERILIPLIEDHDGILLKMEGDSMFVIFRRPRKALASVIAMQRVLEEYNKSHTPEEQILLCVGLGFGRVLKIGDSDCFGAEVNAASKLGEDTAQAREILVTENFRDAVGDLEGISFTKLDKAPPGADAAYRVNYTL